MSGRKRTIIDFLSPKPKVGPSSNPSPTPSTPVSPLNSKSNTPTKSTSMQIEIFEQEEPEIDVSFTGMMLDPDSGKVVGVLKRK